MTYVVGLTGGIGSGKSVIAEFFAALGTPIIDADQLAKALVTPTQPDYHKIVAHFGIKVLHPNGELNRKTLREIVFNDEKERKWLENLLHPIILASIKQEISKLNQPYCIVIIPLLVEQIDSYKPLLNHIVVVDTPKAHQLQWATQRDNCNQDLIQKVIRTQAGPEERLKIADTILHNHGSLTDLENKIKDLHQKFLEMARPLS
ncbi:MAG: dephospho-CoA kinase [Proteobacteria bacterium]|nr:dephospho-CoA kinase [Pseudomonadota bacterium]